MFLLFCVFLDFKCILVQENMLNLKKMFYLKLNLRVTRVEDGCLHACASLFEPHV